MSRIDSVTNFLADTPCLHKAAHIFRLDIWLQLAYSPIVSHKELSKRLKTHLIALFSVSALIAGFTYSVSNSNIIFTENNYISNTVRKNLFGLCCVLSFLCAISSTFLSAVYYGFINILGNKHIKWLILKFWYLIDIPITLSASAIILMLISEFITVGGLYDGWVYYIVVGLGGCGVLVISLCLLIVHRLVYSKLIEDNNQRVEQGQPTEQQKKQAEQQMELIIAKEDKESSGGDDDHAL